MKIVDVPLVGTAHPTISIPCETRIRREYCTRLKSDMADETTDKPEETEAAATDATPEPETEKTESASDAEPKGDEPQAESSIADDITLGDGPPAEPEEVRVASVIRGKIDKFGVAMGTGRRKTSVARVRISDGDGKLTINGRELEEYFTTDRHWSDILSPLKATETFGKVDVWVRVNGGGTTGQAGAIVLGIARALQAKNPTLHHTLSSGGYLTRDSRMVERKKPGLRKARRSFQFSKR